MRPAVVPEATNRGLKNVGRGSLSNPRGVVWSGRTDHSRNRAILQVACSLARGRTRHGPPDFIRPKRPDGSLEFAVFQLAGTCRSVRRSRPVVVPDRRLPHLRIRTDRRKCPLSTRSTGATSCWKCVDLLFNAHRRHRSRPMIGRGSMTLGCSGNSAAAVRTTPPRSRVKSRPAVSVDHFRAFPARSESC